MTMQTTTEAKDRSKYEPPVGTYYGSAVMGVGRWDKMPSGDFLVKVKFAIPEVPGLVIEWAGFTNDDDSVKATLASLKAMGWAGKDPDDLTGLTQKVEIKVLRKKSGKIGVYVNPIAQSVALTDSFKNKLRSRLGLAPVGDDEDTGFGEPPPGDGGVYDGDETF